MSGLKKQKLSCLRRHSTDPLVSSASASGKPFGLPHVTLGDPSGILWGPEDPLGTSWGRLRDPWGTPWGSLGDPWGLFGALEEPLGYPLGLFGYVLRFLGETLATFWESLGSSFGHFGCLPGTFGGRLGAPKASQRPPKGPPGDHLGASCTLRKRSRSDSLQYAKTFKFTVRYCKNQGPGILKPLKISCKFLKTREKTHKNHKLNNTVSKIDKDGAQ